MKAEEISHRLRSRQIVEIGPGDHALNPNMKIVMDEFLRPAAVLVLLVPVENELSIVLTERSVHLKSHAGQVSFPGGRVDENDADEITTALREAQEEIGLDTAAVTVLGRLDHYRTVSNFLVKPVVAFLPELPQWIPNRDEVADIFTVPLKALMQSDNLKLHRVMMEGVERSYYAFNYQNHFIWGATAGILKDFVDILSAENKYI